jgi:hypothetical protein
LAKSLNASFICSVAAKNKSVFYFILLVRVKSSFASAPLGKNQQSYRPAEAAFFGLESIRCPRRQ